MPHEIIATRALARDRRRPLGGNRAPLRTGGRLQDMEESEADGLLQFSIAFDLDVRSPEVIEVTTLIGEQSFFAGQAQPDFSRRERSES